MSSEIVKRVLVAWGDYDPSDYEPHLTEYAEEIDPPDWEIENATDELEKQVKPILRNLSKFFKKMGFRVDVNEYEPPTYGGYHDNITTVVYEIDLIVKGGQKLVLDRKQWVSDGNYKPNMIIAFHSVEAGDIEEGEPYEVQIDVDDFERKPTYYTLPSGDFEYFEFIDGEVPRELFNEEFYNPRRDLEKALRSWVMWFTYQNGQMRSKWKKKRASALVQKVALLKLQKIARLESHADFVKAINYAFMNREDESMLSSISSQARSFEDTEFGKEVSDLCDELIGRLQYMEELRDDGSRYSW